MDTILRVLAALKGVYGNVRHVVVVVAVYLVGGERIVRTAVNTLALPGVSAADPVPRKVRNRRRINPLGTGSMGWSRFSPFVRWTLGPFFT